METNKEKSLPRRVQSLQRFLLERLRSELAQRKSQPPPEPNSPAAEPKQATAAAGNAAEWRSGGTGGGSGGSAPDQAPGNPTNPSGEVELQGKGSEVGGPSGNAMKGKNNEVAVTECKGNDFPAPEEMAAGLDGLFGVLMQQRIRCLYGEKAEKTQEILSFQVFFFSGPPVYLLLRLPELAAKVVRDCFEVAMHENDILTQHLQ